MMIFKILFSSCQNQKFQISDSNVFAMYQLSLKYNVPNLLKITKELIEKNHSNLIINFFEYKSQNQLDFCEEKDAVSTNFHQYIYKRKEINSFFFFFI